MMAKSVGNSSSGFIRSIKERALLKKEKQEQKKREVPYLDKDCITNVLIRLPVESLHNSRFVCKPWHNIISSPVFIDAHLRRSDRVLIFLKSFTVERSHTHPTALKPEGKSNFFSVEAGIRRSQSGPVSMFEQPVLNQMSKFCIQFIEFREGKCEIGEYKVSCLGQIRAACNGLILLDNKLKEGVIVMNPVTKKLMALPVGTIFPSHKESYGFALSDVTRKYKVVHLFRDQSGYISCETLILGTRLWKEVNGPSFGLLSWFGYEPVSAIGALHWIPHIDRSDYIVSMEVDNEKFHTIPLPKSCRQCDRIIEMGGFLCFVTHEELNISIWNLKNLCGGSWTFQYQITKGSIIDMVPLLSLRISGDLIFKREEDGSFYAYDFRNHEMKMVEMDEKLKVRSYSYLPHINSLV